MDNGFHCTLTTGVSGVALLPYRSSVRLASYVADQWLNGAPRVSARPGAPVTLWGPDVVESSARQLLGVEVVAPVQ